MKYQFLTISGDTVLLLDIKRNVVVRYPIEDYAPDYEVEEFEDNIDRQPYRPIKKRTMRRRVIPEDILDEDEPEQPKRPITERPKPMIPAHLAGVFKSADTPGAAIETRRA